jgi:hypothetical protein
VVSVAHKDRAEAPTDGHRGLAASGAHTDHIRAAGAFEAAVQASCSLAEPAAGAEVEVDAAAVEAVPAVARLDAQNRPSPFAEPCHSFSSPASAGPLVHVPVITGNDTTIFN